MYFFKNTCKWLEHILSQECPLYETKQTSEPNRLFHEQEIYRFDVLATKLLTFFPSSSVRTIYTYIMICYWTAKALRMIVELAWAWFVTPPVFGAGSPTKSGGQLLDARRGVRSILCGALYQKVWWMSNIK